MHNSSENQRGIAILDTILALFFFAALMAMASFPGHLFLGDRFLRQTGQSLLATIDTQARRAVAERQEVALLFDSETNRVLVRDTARGDARWREVFEFPVGMNLTRVRFGSVTSGDGGRILRLQPDGVASPGSFTFGVRGNSCSVIQALRGARRLQC